jgi:hypothetical protein
MEEGVATFWGGKKEDKGVLTLTPLPPRRTVDDIDLTDRHLKYYIYIDILLCIYCSKVQKTHFFNDISSKNFKSLNGPRFNSCISISYTIKKFTQEFHSQP